MTSEETEYVTSSRIHVNEVINRKRKKYACINTINTKELRKGGDGKSKERGK